MATHSMLAKSAELRKTAKLLSEAADRMAETRNAQMELDPPGITPGEFSHSILRENAMRNAVTSILLTAIDAAIEDVQGDQAQLEKAIKDAGDKIKKIDNFKKAISIFANLIGLAEAIVLRDPSAILTAFTNVKAAAEA